MLMSLDVTPIVGAATVPKKLAVPPASNVAPLALTSLTELSPPAVTWTASTAVRSVATTF
jgi:hypothetical protein